MDIYVKLSDLPILHPKLLWDDIAAAPLAVLRPPDKTHPIALELQIENVPDFGTKRLAMNIEVEETLLVQASRLRRTYEPSRLVELAAIAIAGVGLYHAGGHEMRDVALRGSGADYLVDEENILMEVAGRSRRKDFDAAWRSRWGRLSTSMSDGFFVCVVEFETPSGRLVFGRE